MESNLSDLYHEITAEPAPPQARLGLSTFAWQALGYLLALTVAEVVTTLIEPRLGLALHGIALVALITHASLSLGRLQGGFFLALAFGSLIRLLSLSTPLLHFPKVYWYMVIGAPLLLAAFVAARVSNLERKMVGAWVSWRSLPVEFLVGASGLGLGLLEYIILRPEPLATHLSLEEIWLPALILMVFTGFLEEYIFRGLMQYTAIRGLGRFGLFYVALVFAALHIGYRSVFDVIFVFIVAIYFGWVVTRTGSLLGVTLAHGLTNISLFLIYPFLAASMNTIIPGIDNVRLPTFPAVAPVSTTYTATPLETTPTPQATSTALGHSKTSAPTATISPTLIGSPTASPGFASTNTPLLTHSATATRRPSATFTEQAASITHTLTATPTPPPTATRSLTPTKRPTETPSPSYTPSASPSPSPTRLLPPSSPLPELYLIVDDGDALFITKGGPFTPSTLGFYDDMRWAPTALSISSAEAEWRYPYSTCGRYTVEVYVPSPGAASASAIYQIGHRAGLTSKLIDQSAYPGKWVSLGEWEFLPTSGSFVRLTNATGEDPILGLRVYFDAVRWTFISPCN